MGGPNDSSSTSVHSPPRVSAAGDTLSATTKREQDKWMPTRLHIALWNGNLAQIRACIRDPDALETRDKRGNRALHLALKFAHCNVGAITKCLVDAGARVRSRDTSGWKTIHHAIAVENEDLLRLLVQREKEQAPALLAKKINAICPQLAQLADFYCEIRVDVSTWIPGVSRWLPSDTIKIWKRARDIRFDISLVGFESGGWKRGRLSFLLLGGSDSESGRSGQFVCLDHEAHACMDLLAPGAPLEDADVDAMVHFLLTTSIITSEFDVSNVAFQEKHRWLSRASVVQDTGRWKDTRVFDMTGVKATLRVRKPQNPRHPGPATAPTAKDGTATPEATSDAFSDLADALADDSHTKVTVDASATHVVSTELRANETVTWTFTTDKYDIAFGVQCFSEASDGNNDHNYSDDTSDNNNSSVVDVVPLQRCASHEQEQRGSFRATRAGTVVFTWDNTFSRFRSKTLNFTIQSLPSTALECPSASENGEVQLDRCHRAREEPMTFEDWFGVSIDALPPHLQAMHPKHQIMVHAQPRSRELTKSFPATVYMSDEFPMSVHEFLPVVELLSKTTSAFENVKEFFEAFCFPLLPSISATFSFNTMELHVPEATLFAIPDTYSTNDDAVLSPRKQQEVLQRVAAV